MHGCVRLTGAFGVAGEVGLDGIFKDVYKRQFFSFTIQLHECRNFAILESAISE